MFQDDERALAVERTAVASVRVDLINLALWSDWMNKQGLPPKSTSQAVGSALNYIVDLLRSHGQITESITLSQAAVMLDENRLLQKGMYGRRGRKIGTFMSFENMRMEGDDPRTSDMFNRLAYAKLHANDERTTLPLQVLGNETVGRKVEEEETITKKTANNWKSEELTREDIEELKEIWIAMSEEEKFIVQKKVYRNNAGGERERWEDIALFYTRFKPIPEEYMPDNLTKEVEDSDEYQEWAHNWFTKRDAFVRAMRAMIPELVGNKERLKFDENGVVVNVPSTGAGIITKEQYDEHMRQEEENKKQAMIEREKERLLRKEAAKEAKEALGINEEEKEPKSEPVKKTQEEIEADDEEKFLSKLNSLTEG